MSKTMTDTDAIDRLILSKEYRKLQTLKPEFNLFTLLDDALREPAWSRMFAGILDSTLPHELGTDGIREWLALVAAEARENNSEIPAFVSEFPEGSVVRVFVEHVTPKGRRIDILVRILDPKHRVVAVVGIENKLGSPEQPAQISDYQAALSEEFRKGVHRLIVYLTPNRREARTASANAECPYLPASYRTMVGMCRRLAMSAAPQVGVLLDSLSREIENEVLGEDKMIRDAEALVGRLWLDPHHRKALRLIAECVPTPRKHLDAGLRSRIEQGVKTFGMQLDDDGINYYPKRSESPHEIQVYCGGRLAELTGRFGFDLCYMLHCSDRNPDAGSEFSLRLMAWCESARGRQRVINLGLCHSLPSGDLKSWSSWQNVWTGGSYCLVDLGPQDLEGLGKLLLDGVRATFPSIAKAIGTASASAGKTSVGKQRK